MFKSLQQWKIWQTIRQHRDSKTLIMGVSWYRPEQWERLREIAEDKENWLSGILRGVKLLYYQLLMSTDRRANLLRSESSGAPDF
jgi:hypothetical protein